MVWFIYLLLRKMSISVMKSPFESVIQSLDNGVHIDSGLTEAIEEINYDTAELGYGVCVETEVFTDSTLTERLPVSSENLNGNFGMTCRCCLAEHDELIAIFDSDDNSIYSMMILLTSIRVSADDALPKNICADCFDQLSKSTSFKQQIETADATLRQCIAERWTYRMLLEKSIIKKEMRKLSELTFEDDKNEANHDLVFDDDPIDEDYEIDYIIEYEAEPILYSDCEEYKLEPDMQKLASPIQQTENLEDIEPDLRKSTNELKSPIAHDAELKKRRKCMMYACRKCDKKFNSRQLFVKHLKTHPKDKLEHSCPICSRTFTRPASLEFHIRMHRVDTEPNTDSDTSFACDKCDMSFTFKRDLYIHGSIHADDGTFTCRECSKEFPNLPKLKRHVKTHFQDKPIKCEECGRGFPEIASLTRHFRVHTGEQRDRKYICSFCKKAYYDSHSLSIHIRTHTGEKPWACDKCDKRFADSRLLNSHMKTHLNERAHVCTICDKGFTHRSTLTSHMRTHTGEKPFACTVCNKTFIQSSNLILHLRVHSGEKPYKCTKCPKAFGSSSTLAMHMRIHTGEKPYCCKLCGKRFARHNLTAHMRTHTGEKPYECTECSRTFTTSGQLTHHKRTHTGDKLFACEICNKSWATSSYLKKHMQTHNVNENPTESLLIEKNFNHRIRIEEIRSDAEFNENEMLVSDLLAAVVDTSNTNSDALHDGNVAVPELSTTDLNPGFDLNNAINPNILRRPMGKDRKTEPIDIYMGTMES